MEPNYLLLNVVLILVPFGAYYCGIFIRRFALPPAAPTPLLCQCLLGIPVSLVVVSPFVPILIATSSSVPGYLVTLGIIIEHGMLVHETAVKHLRELGKTPVSIAAQTTVS